MIEILRFLNLILFCSVLIVVLFFMIWNMNLFENCLLGFLSCSRCIFGFGVFIKVMLISLEVKLNLILFL